MIRKVFLAIIMSLTLWSCTSDTETKPEIGGPDPVEFNRSEMLANFSDNIIIPSYEDFDQKMDNLNTSFIAFKANPETTTFSALRASWLDAYKIWQHASIFEIGPAESIDYRLNMNIYPADIEKIDEHIASATYDLSLASNRDTKGFPALDYLFYGIAEDDEAIIQIYSGSNGTNYLSYTEDLIADMSNNTKSVLAEWKNGYRDTFVANDGSSATASLDRFVNDYIFYFEKFLRAGKMGIPAGVFSGTSSVSKIEALYQADISKELFLEGLTATQKLFNGDHYIGSETGLGFATYLEVFDTAKDGQSLAKLINNQFTTARQSVQSLNSFKNEIENNVPPQNFLSAYDAVQRLVPLLKIDMVSAMNINIDFVDADGD